MYSTVDSVLITVQLSVPPVQAAARATIVLEDAGETNAGYGSNLTESGTVEMDAGLMDGSRYCTLCTVNCTLYTYTLYSHVHTVNCTHCTVTYTLYT